MDAESLKKVKRGQVAILGLPWDCHSSFLRGPAEAPALIRGSMTSEASHRTAECGTDLSDEQRVVMLGDLDLDKGDDAAVADMGFAVSSLVGIGALPLLLGGDHAVTFPIFKGFGAAGVKPHILHFDAHPDLYEDFEGDPLSHASPFARILEQDLAASLTQVGIRTLNGTQRSQVDRYGVRVYEMRQGFPARLKLEGPLYISFDMDALDPSAAPGVSHHEPGGPSVREVLQLLHSIDVPIVGADVVEYNPRRDFAGMTAAAAAKIVKEIAALMLTHGPR